MHNASTVPDASLYRLSLYHCYLGEQIRQGAQDRLLTSRGMADDLGIMDATVRRDLSYVGGVGTTGSGYRMYELCDALAGFLGISDEYPIVRVGTAQMLGALEVVFPPDAYSVRPVAYYSELPEDAGKTLGDIEIRHIDEIPSLDPGLGVRVALVACSQPWVEPCMTNLWRVGVDGVLLLTPKVTVSRPEGMRVRHVRMPCDIKSLAAHCAVPVGAVG